MVIEKLYEKVAAIAASEISFAEYQPTEISGKLGKNHKNEAKQKTYKYCLVFPNTNLHL
jgi:hypothetical protein